MFEKATGDGVRTCTAAALPTHPPHVIVTDNASSAETILAPAVYIVFDICCGL